MNFSAVMILLYCAASLAQDSSSLEDYDAYDQDDRWNLGILAYPTENLKAMNKNDVNNFKSSTSTNVFPDPNYTPPQKKKTGRRISDKLLLAQDPSRLKDTLNKTVVNYRKDSTSTYTNLSPECPIYSPPQPSFKKPGRRISDEKCEEYKWNKVVAEEAKKRQEECAAKIDEEEGPGPGAIGGRSTDLGEFPHMVAIGWKTVDDDGYVFQCGGSLISSKFVLTVAHCSKIVRPDLADAAPKLVRLNDKNILQTDEQGFGTTEDVDISRIIVHPEYKPPLKYFDIALLELEAEVSFTWRMYPACLWTNTDVNQLKTEATATGWGVLVRGSGLITPELQVVVLDVIDNTLCEKLLYIGNVNFRGLRDNQLCAGKLAGGVDTCQGDSGGPLQVKEHVNGTVDESIYHVIGLTSFGRGCAEPNRPGVYTRVSSFIDWIEGHVWPIETYKRFFNYV